MSVATDSPITEALQGLIDARLDTIDRMLVGRVTRQDRLAIVREVESQIHDLLAERPGADLDREAVLAVLARLDPPEAYLPDDSGEVAGPTARVAPARVAPAPARPASDAEAVKGKMGRVSGIIGLIALGLVLLVPTALVAGELSGSATFFLIATGLDLFATLVCGVLAVGFAAYARVRGGWAITGLVTGLVSCGIATVGVIVLVLYGS